MARSVLWQCDNCKKESRAESGGWLMIKSVRANIPRPLFYAFCSWKCMDEFAHARIGVPR